MLINDFYTTLDMQHGDNQYSCRIIFNAGHAIFSGHFPGQPVVPGVCMMEIVKELLQQKLCKSLVLRNAGNIKFLQLISPDVQPIININWKESDDGYKVTAFFTNDAAILFKLDGNYSVV